MNALTREQVRRRLFELAVQDGISRNDLATLLAECQKLRDSFAGRALQGFLAQGTPSETAVGLSFKTADDMMVARQPKNIKESA